MFYDIFYHVFDAKKSISGNYIYQEDMYIRVQIMSLLASQTYWNCEEKEQDDIKKDEHMDYWRDYRQSVTESQPRKSISRTLHLI